MSNQPTLFDPPPPPSGPKTDMRKFGDRAGATYDHFISWRYSEGGRRVWAYIETAALAEADRGAERISINRLVEAARHATHCEVNNTWRAFLSDSLVSRHPQLAELIERRKRRLAA